MTTVFHRLWPALKTSLVIIIAGWSPGVYSESEVTDVRFWYGPDKTRLVLELTSAATYRVFSLENPERVVIDIDQGRLDQGVELANNAGGLVANIRSGRPEPGIFRIVLDVRGKLGIHALSLIHI